MRIVSPQSHQGPGKRRGTPASLVASLLVIGFFSLADSRRIHGAPAQSPENWVVDLGRTHGTIRSLHGVNGGPLCYRGTVDLRARHRELGIPLTRLHDTVWINAEAVDVHTIFRDPRADPTDPANYDFRATDDYVKAVRDTGAAVVYRLGESIEHTQSKYWVHPPAEPERWAAVCAGIVRHYEQGWANGMTNAVRYWEIWNEPDVRPAMWTGSDDEFLRLFELTTRAIRARVPEARVGGPGFGGVGALTSEGFRPSAFASAFLRTCRERRLPIDFFSWHRYTADTASIGTLAVAVRRWLDAEGFASTESHLNEWNYLPDDDWGPMLQGGNPEARDAWYARIGGAEGAAFAAAVLVQAQDWPIDAANYYTGEIQGFGLFTMSGQPRTTFHAFRAFHDLLATPLRASVHPENLAADVGGLSALAGRDAAGTAGAALWVNASRTDRMLAVRLIAAPWGPATLGTIRLIDEMTGHGGKDDSRGCDVSGDRMLLRLPPRSVVFLRLRPPGSAPAESR